MHRRTKRENDENVSKRVIDLNCVKRKTKLKYKNLYEEEFSLKSNIMIVEEPILIIGNLERMEL